MPELIDRDDIVHILQMNGCSEVECPAMERKVVAADLKSVYRAATSEEAEQQLVKFTTSETTAMGGPRRCGGGSGSK